MTIQTTYTHARDNLAELCNQVIANRDTVVIQRRGHEDVVLIAASELNSLMEVAHLLRSPRNAERLLTALSRAQHESLPTQSIDELRHELGLADA